MVPQILAFAHYHLSWLLCVLRPAWSYGLNADFMDHAEHEYALFVEDNPALEERSYDGLFAQEYGRSASLADLSAKSATTSTVHKQDSLDRMADARTGDGRKIRR